jgi:hypothetical protein
MQTKKRIPSYATKIAKEILNIETLETRNSDRLDFHEVAARSVLDALEAAFEAGKKAATK